MSLNKTIRTGPIARDGPSDHSVDFASLELFQHLLFEIVY